MSVSDELAVKLGSIPEVDSYDVNKHVKLYGEPATRVLVKLRDGRTVMGVFTTEDKTGFGGVQFSSRKDIPALMASKVKSVLAGTAEV